ncbi:uncharacterized protein K452DRAFT_333212, partial [Aplosporella prunicola CBS 121167]
RFSLYSQLLAASHRIPLSSLHVTLKGSYLPFSNQPNSIMGTATEKEEIRRLFDPSEDICTQNIPRSELIIYNPKKQTSELQMTCETRPFPFRDTGTLVIHLHGACHGNGKLNSNAKASYGIYLGPGSRYNTEELLPSSLPQTSTCADVYGLAHALEIVKNIAKDDARLERVKIATDSRFLIQAMTEWMNMWIEHKGFTPQGRPVAHFETLRNLHDSLNYLESAEGGYEVQFWHVPREMNKEAYALAYAALDDV